jgi:TonB-linked SusC/RagA family outer membrane protein
MKKLLQSLFILVFVAGTAMAQERTITGTVTGKDDGLPIPGVSVKVVGTQNGTSTDANGKYALNVASGQASIEFSSIGYVQHVVPVGASNVVNAALVTDAKQLGEVVVVAYGVQNKRNVVGSISTVSASQIESQKIVTVGQALQGVAAGVQVINNVGQPGETPQIRIRGIGSVNASAAPLYVVDGVVVDDFSAGSGSNSTYGGAVSALNPADIESMSVLKDASAAALYGSRAANGVILITTKSGSFGQKPTISFGTAFGTSSRAVKEYPFLSSDQYMKMAWQALQIDGAKYGEDDPGQYATDNLIGFLGYNPYGINNPIDRLGNLASGAHLLWDTDWEKELTRKNALRKEYNLSVAGGSEKSKYYIGGSYLDQDGYTITSNYKRANARANYTTNVTDWLELGVKTAISSSNQNYPTQSGSSYANNIQYIRTMASIYPVYEHDDQGKLILDSNGQPIYDFGNYIPGRSVNMDRPVLNPSNLIGTTNLDNNKYENFLTTINVYGDFKLYKGLNFRTNYAVDRNVYSGSEYQNPEFGDADAVQGRLAKERDLSTSSTWNNMLTYNNKFGDHSLNAMVSMEAYKYKFDYMRSSITGFPFPGLDAQNTGSVNEAVESSTSETTLLSYLSRISYNYKEKYFIEGAIRLDKSSKFAPTKRTGYFPSIGASWLMSNEDFIKDANTFSYLKLRASYGQTGNNNLLSSTSDFDYFPYLPLFNVLPNLSSPGVYLTSIGNPNITWEKISTSNVGLDFGILDDRLTGTVEYFYKKTTNLLFRVPLVTSGGMPVYPDNIGSLRNTGVELLLNSVNIDHTDFKWKTSLNLSTVRNKFLSLSQPSIVTGNYKYQVGASPYDFFIEEWAGVDPADGAPMWYKDVTDANGNITRQTTKLYSEATASRVYMGSALPKLTGGFSNNMQYKNFDFSFLINFSVGGKIYDSDYAGLMGGFSRPGNQLSADMLNFWQSAGQQTDVPVLNLSTTNAPNSRSSRFLVDASYLRLRNVSLGYTLKPTVFNKPDLFKTFRLYIQADNMLTLARAHSGLDPEQSIAGTTNNRSSIFKTYSIGLNLTF